MLNNKELCNLCRLFSVGLLRFVQVRRAVHVSRGGGGEENAHCIW